MDYENFKAAYNDQFKQTVTYRTAAGEKLQGLLISDVFWGVIGSKLPYVNVNNWHTAVALADVIGLKTTTKPW